MMMFRPDLTMDDESDEMKNVTNFGTRRAKPQDREDSYLKTPSLCFAVLSPLSTAVTLYAMSLHKCNAMRHEDVRRRTL